MDEIHRPYHEVANIFPLMQGADYEALKADIAEYGQREPIWLHPDGSIIDGRNRHRVCVELGIVPEFETWNGHGSLVAFVVSLNLHRRHLDAGQKAFVALKIKDELAKEIAIEKAEKGRAAIEKRWYGPSAAETDGTLFVAVDKTEDQNIGFDINVETYKEERDSKKEAAAIVGVSQGYVNSAQRLTEDAPDLAEQVQAGDLKMTAAMRELKHRQKQEAPPLPTNNYRVWYADPPWHYGNSGAIGDTDNYGHAERHYPSMTIEELCAMGVSIKERATDDAVLFMWVTSPLLEECFPVIRAWGFQYKTSFVWDKVGHNYGHYNSVRHEFLLVCTRGSCTPDEKTLFDSVVSIEKSRKHSEKPEEFRRIIDTLYTQGNRIELFARTPADGWDAWGNEA